MIKNLRPIRRIVLKDLCQKNKKSRRIAETGKNQCDQASIRGCHTGNPLLILWINRHNYCPKSPLSIGFRTCSATRQDTGSALPSAVLTAATSQVLFCVQEARRRLLHHRCRALNIGVLISFLPPGYSTLNSFFAWIRPEHTLAVSL